MDVLLCYLVSDFNSFVKVKLDHFPKARVSFNNTVTEKKHLDIQEIKFCQLCHIHIACFQAIPEGPKTFRPGK